MQMCRAQSSCERKEERCERRKARAEHPAAQAGFSSGFAAHLRCKVICALRHCQQRRERLDCTVRISHNLPRHNSRQLPRKQACLTDLRQSQRSRKCSSFQALLIVHTKQLQATCTTINMQRAAASRQQVQCNWAVRGVGACLLHLCQRGESLRLLRGVVCLNCNRPEFACRRDHARGARAHQRPFTAVGPPMLDWREML